MTEEISQHAWFAERIAAYLTDGLDAGERTQFEMHAEQCPACAGKLAAAKAEDEALLGIFGKMGPTPGFEDRVIQKLRIAGERRKFVLGRGIRLHPRVIRAAGAAAAIIVLGGLGYGVTQMENRVELASRIECASNLRQSGQAVYSASDVAPQQYFGSQDNQS